MPIRICSAPLLRLVTTSMVIVNGMNTISVMLPATNTEEKNAKVISATISLCTASIPLSNCELTTWNMLTCRNLYIITTR